MRQIAQSLSNGKQYAIDLPVPNLKDKVDQDQKGVCLDECQPENQELFSTYYNDIRHQFRNSECGVYSMHFIISFLELYSRGSSNF